MQRLAGTGMFRHRSRERAALMVCLGFLLMATGCASRGDVELLEARLRNQEMQLRQAERKASELATDLQVAEKEQNLLRSQLAGQSPIIPVEATQALASATGLKFHTLLTSGQDRDGIQGDEKLHLFLFPHDADGEIVKLNGELEVEIFDPAQPGGMQSIGRWLYPEDECRKLWHSGFLSSGFQTEVPLETVPNGSKLILHGRLTTVDGRQFDASHTVTIAARTGSHLERGTIDTVTTQPPFGRETTEVGVSAIIPTRFTDEVQGFSETPPDSTERLVPDPYADRPDWESLPFPTDQPLPRAHRPGTLLDKAPALEAAPFPNGLRTSDSWTDETIPAVR